MKTENYEGTDSKRYYEPQIGQKVNPESETKYLRLGFLLFLTSSDCANLTLLLPTTEAADTKR